MDLATMAHPTTVGMGMGPVGKLSPTSPPGAAGPLLSLIYPPRRGLPATRALQASLSNDSQPSRHRRSSAEWAVSMSRYDRSLSELRLCFPSSSAGALLERCFAWTLCFPRCGVAWAKRRLARKGLRMDRLVLVCIMYSS